MRPSCRWIGHCPGNRAARVLAGCNHGKKPRGTDGVRVSRSRPPEVFGDACGAGGAGPRDDGGVRGLRSAGDRCPFARRVRTGPKRLASASRGLGGCRAGRSDEHWRAGALERRARRTPGRSGCNASAGRPTTGAVVAPSGSIWIAGASAGALAWAQTFGGRARRSGLARVRFARRAARRGPVPAGDGGRRDAVHERRGRTTCSSQRSIRGSACSCRWSDASASDSTALGAPTVVAARHISRIALADTATSLPRRGQMPLEMHVSGRSGMRRARISSTVLPPRPCGTTAA